LLVEGWYKKIDRINMGKNLKKSVPKKIGVKTWKKLPNIVGGLKNDEKKLKKAYVQNSHLCLLLVLAKIFLSDPYMKVCLRKIL
jgi:hypothetical protein